MKEAIVNITKIILLGVIIFIIVSLVGLSTGIITWITGETYEYALKTRYEYSVFAGVVITANLEQEVFTNEECTDLAYLYYMRNSPYTNARSSGVFITTHEEALKEVRTNEYQHTYFKINGTTYMINWGTGYKYLLELNQNFEYKHKFISTGESPDVDVYVRINGFIFANNEFLYEKTDDGWKRADNHNFWWDYVEFDAEYHYINQTVASNDDAIGGNVGFGGGGGGRW